MITFRELTQKYLAWVKIHQAPLTYTYYEGYIEKYLLHLGGAADQPAEEMKTHQVNDWVDSHAEDWGDNYRRGAAVAINRVFNWGVNDDRIAINPIKKAHKPPAVSRKTFAKPEDVDKILAHIHPDDPFRDFITVLWHSFARPQEIRHIEARHVDLVNRQIVFPAKESKGKRHPRCILIFKTTFPIVEKLVAKYPEGKIFRNLDGEAWTKSAVCSRMNRLSTICGKKLTAYDLRHGIITAALEAGKGHMDIAAASGHVDGSMVGKVYSHVHENKDRIRDVFGG